VAVVEERRGDDALPWEYEEQEDTCVTVRTVPVEGVGVMIMHDCLRTGRSQVMCTGTHVEGVGVMITHDCLRTGRSPVMCTGTHG